MLTISLNANRSLAMSGAGGKLYELYFNEAGNPVAFRIKILQPHLGNEWLLHKVAGARLPKGWRENSQIEEHNNGAFQSKLISLMHIAAAA
jgi:hypothetical protein